MDDDFLLEEDTQKGKFMTFICGEEYYGIEIRYVQEIICMQKITEVPETPPYVKGLINLRGKIHPVIDVRIRFHKEPREYNDRTCIIVTEVDKIVVGLIVDTIAGVVDIKEEDICPSVSIGKDSTSFIYGIGKIGEEVKLLIDPKKLLSEDVAEQLGNIAQ
ncbi:MAG: chemotaxis protein CheW [Lachnospiraceae bacterium]|nr:chemotaxis protein CheW [Lachnospiraceae bacterium]